jgi:short-subunit dehydrogenase
VTEAFNYYKSVKKGSIAAISSIASIRGSDDAPAYNASKAFVTNYMDGLRRKSIKEKLNINITTIMPGLVDTQMAKGEGLFWVEPVDLIAKQIIRGIWKKKAELVVSNRWKLISILLKLLPSWLYYRL